MIDGYREFLDYCELHHLINSQNGLIGPGSANRKNLKKEKMFAENTLRELTKALPEETSNALRMRIIRCNFSMQEVLCPVCGTLKIWSTEAKSCFRLTCGLGDREHKDYIQKYKVKFSFAEFGGNPMKSKAIASRARQTQKDRNGGVLGFNRPEVIEKTSQITQDRFVEYREIKEAGGPGYNPDLPILGRSTEINRDNYSLITKEYLLEHYVNGGIADHEGLCKFLNVTVGKTYNIFYDFEIDLLNAGAGFDQLKPAILYYIQDLITGWYKIGITNRTVSERFSQAKDRYRLIREQYFTLGIDAKTEEIRLHHLYDIYRIENFTWDKVIGGRTEFFIIDVLGLDTPKLLPAP